MVRYSTVVQWYTHTVVHWYNGIRVTLVKWHEQWYSFAIVHWYTTLLVYYCTIVPVYNYTPEVPLH